MTFAEPKPKQFLRPIITGANCAMNQSQSLELIAYNSLKARENCAHGAIGFGFASHRLKNRCESFKPITKSISHLKTTLTVVLFLLLFFVWIMCRSRTFTKDILV